MAIAPVSNFTKKKKKEGEGLEPSARKKKKGGEFNI